MFRCLDVWILDFLISMNITAETERKESAKFRANSYLIYISSECCIVLLIAVSGGLVSGVVVLCVVCCCCRRVYEPVREKLRTYISQLLQGNNAGPFAHKCILDNASISSRLYSDMISLVFIAQMTAKAFLLLFINCVSVN